MHYLKLFVMVLLVTIGFIEANDSNANTSNTYGAISHSDGSGKDGGSECGIG